MSAEGDALGDELIAARDAVAAVHVSGTPADRTAFARADGNAIIDHLREFGAVTVLEDGVEVGTRASLNFIGASVVDNVADDRIDITITGGGGGADPYDVTPETISPDAAGAAGSSDDYARGDHVHPIAAATAVSIGTSNSEGASSSFARADHTHRIDDGSVSAAKLNFDVATQAELDAVESAAASAFGAVASELATHAALTTTAHGGLVPSTRQVIAGAGTTGGGPLSGDVTLNVIAHADGSIVANANDVQVGVLATDAQHGARAGGTQHAVAVASGAAGFLSGADKAKLDGITASAAVASVSGTAPIASSGGTTPAISLNDDGVSDAKLRNSAALSVIGRSANSSGDPADIAAATDTHILRRSGTSLGFGTIRRSAVSDLRDPRVGRLLFALTDQATQLDAPVKFERSGGSTGGGNGDTAVTIGTQALSGTLAKWGTANRVIATSLAGGAFIPIKSAAIDGGVLPAHFFVYIELIQVSVTNLFVGPMLHARISAGDFEGACIEHNSGASTHVVRAIVNNRVGSSESLAAAGTFGSGSADRMGYKMLAEVWRQDGAATALAIAQVLTWNGDSGISQDGAATTAISGVSTNWDSVDHDRAGVFVHEAINGVTGNFDFGRLELYAGALE